MNDFNLFEFIAGTIENCPGSGKPSKNEHDGFHTTCHTVTRGYR